MWVREFPVAPGQFSAEVGAQSAGLWAAEAPGSPVPSSLETVLVVLVPLPSCGCPEALRTSQWLAVLT